MIKSEMKRETGREPVCLRTTHPRNGLVVFTIRVVSFRLLTRTLNELPNVVVVGLRSLVWHRSFDGLLDSTGTQVKRCTAQPITQFPLGSIQQASHRPW